MTATAATDFTFVEWQLDGISFDTSPEINFTPNADEANFVAIFSYTPNYDPDSPDEPGDIGPMIRHHVEVSINDTEAGTVSGGGTYDYNQSVSISTSKNFGYRFVHWLLDGQVYSTQTSFNYTVGQQDVSFHAVYEYIGSYVVTLVAEPADGGTFNQTSGTAYETGSSYSVTTRPTTDQVFKGWYIDGKQVGSSLTYTLTALTQDVTLTAKFVYDPGSPKEPGDFVDVKLTCLPEGAGTTTPSGYTFMEVGSTFALNASPNEGYTFMGWYRGNTLLSSEAEYIHSVSIDDKQLVARFTPTVPILGDVNADMLTTIGDEAMLISVLNGGEDLFALSDVDGDGTVSTSDVEVVKQIILGLPITVQSVSITPTAANVTKGLTYSLSAQLYPSFANDLSLTWSSADESIASVSAEGIVTGIEGGSTTITATAGNGLSASCAITVITAVYYEDWTSTNAGKSSSTSSHTYTIEHTAGQTLSFDWTVSSESSYDFLIVTLDGTQVLKQSGVLSGTYTKTFTTNSTSTLVVSYKKDGSVNKNDDKATIKNMKLE